MSINEGDRIPDVKVTVPGDDGAPQPTQTGELLGKGRVVLFAVPGTSRRAAPTPTCRGS